MISDHIELRKNTAIEHCSVSKVDPQELMKSKAVPGVIWLQELLLDRESSWSFAVSGTHAEESSTTHHSKTQGQNPSQNLGRLSVSNGSCRQSVGWRSFWKDHE